MKEEVIDCVFAIYWYYASSFGSLEQHIHTFVRDIILDYWAASKMLYFISLYRSFGCNSHVIVNANIMFLYLLSVLFIVEWLRIKQKQKGKGNSYTKPLINCESLHSTVHTHALSYHSDSSKISINIYAFSFPAHNMFVLGASFAPSENYCWFVWLVRICNITWLHSTHIPLSFSAGPFIMSVVIEVNHHHHHHPKAYISYFSE